MQGPPSWHPAPPALKEAAAAAATAAAAHGASLPKLAIMQCVQDPAIASHLVGLCTRQQVCCTSIIPGLDDPVCGYVLTCSSCVHLCL